MGSQLNSMLSLLSQVLCLICLYKGSVEDWRTTYITGWTSLLSWVAIFISILLTGQSFLTVLLIDIIFLIYNSNSEIIYFGDADFLFFAMHLSIYGNQYLSVNSLIPLVSLLVVLYPYACFYCKCHGTEYKPFSHTLVPVLPAFAIAWFISVLYNVAHILFHVA